MQVHQRLLPSCWLLENNLMSVETAMYNYRDAEAENVAAVCCILSSGHGKQGVPLMINSCDVLNFCCVQ
jgi:hypothetical protein